MALVRADKLPYLPPQDKACIPQDDIDRSLACLPIFLAGCNGLLIMAGPTYASRLWQFRATILDCEYPSSAM